MLVGYLLCGIIVSMLSVVISLIAGFGFFAALLAYVLGGVLGMAVFGLGHLLAQSNRTRLVLALKS